MNALVNYLIHFLQKQKCRPSYEIDLSLKAPLIIKNSDKQIFSFFLSSSFFFLAFSLTLSLPPAPFFFFLLACFLSWRLNPRPHTYQRTALSGSGILQPLDVSDKTPFSDAQETLFTTPGGCQVSWFIGSKFNPHYKPLTDSGDYKG